jgi:hypothetical protein
MKRAGKKTLAWQREREKLKVRFMARGITSCEARLPGCWGSRALGFAHLDKRRFLKPHQLGDMDQVVLLCSPVCHAYAESLPREEMRIFLQKIIDRRKKLSAPLKPDMEEG